ncbi:hypothetical protein D1BOALGB6SA_10480 [Olavius sp. associated proteobacterium Delta 1]|nr:hypothetical protein D1BOALGB6SA_10480 [Olavius sp. associated proteobacterium Delta 1]
MRKFFFDVSYHAMIRAGWTMLPILSLLFIARLSLAQSIFTGQDGKFEEQTISVPYAFYNEAFGAAAAYAYGKIGYPQKQSAILATAMVGAKGSVMGFFIGRGLRLPWSKRLFLDPIAQIGWFKDADSYTDGNPDLPDERADSK